MPRISEWQIQNALRIHLDGVPEKGIAGHAKPGVKWWHPPNGGTRRDAFEGKRFRDIGVKSGVYDVHLFYQRQLYVLELKDETGKLSAAQIAWGREMAEQGAEVAWANSLERARAWLWHWGLTSKC